MPKGKRKWSFGLENCEAGLLDGDDDGTGEEDQELGMFAPEEGEDECFGGG